jgi:hypothetical protein
MCTLVSWSPKILQTIQLKFWTNILKLVNLLVMPYLLLTQWCCIVFHCPCGIFSAVLLLPSPLIDSISPTIWMGRIDTVFFRINYNNNTSIISVTPDSGRIHIHNVITYTSLPRHSSIKHIHPQEWHMSFENTNQKKLALQGEEH